MAPHDSFALLRKATRLERLLPEARVGGMEKRCTQCGVDVSPMWYRAGEDKVCHQCFSRG